MKKTILLLTVLTLTLAASGCQYSDSTEAMTRNNGSSPSEKEKNETVVMEKVSPTPTPEILESSNTESSDTLAADSSENGNFSETDSSSDDNLQKEETYYPGPDVAELVNSEGDTTTVYQMADGRYMDRTNMVYIFDGDDIWTDEIGVEWNEAVSSADSSNVSNFLENVQDPYDLYSWDDEMQSFIPYQQADGDGQPIGKGNGWYYYDNDTGTYLLW